MHTSSSRGKRKKSAVVEELLVRQFFSSHSSLTLRLIACYKFRQCCLPARNPAIQIYPINFIRAVRRSPKSLNIPFQAIMTFAPEKGLCDDQKNILKIVLPTAERDKHKDLVTDFLWFLHPLYTFEPQLGALVSPTRLHLTSQRYSHHNLLLSSCPLGELL